MQGVDLTPHDLEAERCVLADMLYSRDEGTYDAALTLSPLDFLSPPHQQFFASLERLWRTGSRPDWLTVKNELVGAGQWSPTMDQTLAEIVAIGPTDIDSAVALVTRKSQLRALRDHGSAIVNLALDGATEPGEILDLARERLASIHSPLGTEVDVVGINDFLDRPKSSHSPWVIPGLLRRDFRAIVVAGEGRGKSLLLAQLAVMTAYGLHPLHWRPCPPLPALVIDLENPELSVRNRFEWLIREAQKARGAAFQRNQVHLWHRPAGIDVRTRNDRAQLEEVIRRVRPALVCIGPLYKAFRRKSGENHEDAAEGAQDVFDDLRTRYKFALVIEHHAGQSQGGQRDIRPFGSARWLWWPEIGLKLTPDDHPGVLKVGTWREHREEAETHWPTTLERSKPWPWLGVWPDNRWQEEVF